MSTSARTNASARPRPPPPPPPGGVRAGAAPPHDAGAPPVVALPTTPGTGAEATPFATIWHSDRGRKLCLRGT
ncbi:iron-containing alcohol dehydrogenase, partial [Nocardia brasiliensis]|uniref:iron-containing alcohol dehydrogenase n=1 Tax=Nocardia brasiliensis TaxID=37326 RepID=UPI003D7984A5